MHHARATARRLASLITDNIAIAASPNSWSRTDILDKIVNEMCSLGYLPSGAGSYDITMDLVEGKLDEEQRGALAKAFTSLLQKDDL